MQAVCRLPAEHDDSKTCGVAIWTGEKGMELHAGKHGVLPEELTPRTMIRIFNIGPREDPAVSVDVTGADLRH
jgi:hypothetical protein